jgi:heme exporter protein B
MIRQALYVLRKDLLLEWRGKARILSVFLFGLVALSLFSFAVGPDSVALSRTTPGYLVLTLLLSSTLALTESFRIETSDEAMEGLLLLPVDPTAIFYGKALANTLFLTLLGPILAPTAIVLYAVEVEASNVFHLLFLWALTAAGLSAPGTLYAAMTSRIRGQEVLLPIVHYPLVIPLLLAAVKSMDLALYGDPMGQMGSWTTVLIGFSAVYWLLGGILFRFTVED